MLKPCKPFLTLAILANFILNSQCCFAQKSIYQNNLSTLLTERKAIIYGLVIRTFNAKDLNADRLIEINKGEEQGNFINAIKRLDEISNLGINTIHLLPITRLGKTQALGTAGSVYSPSSFTEIEPSLDDKTNSLNVEEEAKLFISECHKRNIKVMLDLPSCANIELFNQNPELFLTDKRNKPIIPLDWTDIRLFKVYDNKLNKKLNNDLLELHKDFIDFCLKLGIDGIRADVAGLKPAAFWKQIVSYARSKDSNFGFLAESSDSWGGKISPELNTTNHKDLLKVGFDAYYGSYFKVDEWNNADEFFKHIKYNQDLLNNKFKNKSAIGSFATHDEQSPIFTKGLNLAKQIIIFNATLPDINPYYISGFETGDDYLYPYSMKKADKTSTDSDIYFNHKARLDIFNLSDKPSGKYKELSSLMTNSLAFRKKYQDLILKGNFKRLKPHNKNVYSNQIISYLREYKNNKLLVVANMNFKNSNYVELKLNREMLNNYIISYDVIKPEVNSIGSNDDILAIRLKPGEIYLIRFNK